MGFRLVIVSLATICSVASGQAVNSGAPEIQWLLPPEGKILEVAGLRASRGPRELVLWMLHPRKVLVENDPGCSELLYGDHWSGPARLSLVDSVKGRIINTVEIGGDNFPIPFHVEQYSGYAYRTENHKDGTPKILDLQDLTGQGVRGQFVLLEHQACAIALTVVLGYNPQTDTAQQFRVEVIEGGKKANTLENGVSNLFTHKPLQPGRWNVTWDPGHGCECTIHEEVAFDSSRQIFVEKRTITPYPDAATQNKGR